MNCWLRVAGLTMAVSLSWAAAQAEEAAYQVHRFDEDYRFLREPARRTDLWDPVKYVPLTGTGTTYLSLGGEARERYEY
ncbi:MAG TPA: alginate export family protein, partial [Geobacteraceae bacterium]